MAQTTAPPGSPSRRGPAAVLGLVGVGAALAVLVAAALTLLVGGPVDAVPGLSNPGRLTTVALPTVRALAEISMAVAVGALLLAAFLVPPQRSGFLDVAGYRAVRSAAVAAFAWALAAALMVPLTVADTLGRPLGDVLDVGLLAQTVPRLSTATAWLATALIALLVLAACRTVLGWGWTVVTFGLSVIGPLPVALTGHSATGGSHGRGRSMLADPPDAAHARCIPRAGQSRLPAPRVRPMWQSARLLHARCCVAHV